MHFFIRVLFVKINETNCANYPFNIRKMSFRNIFRSDYNSVCRNSEQFVFHWCISWLRKKYAVLGPLLKAGKEGDELSSLYNTSFLSKVLETTCLKQLNKRLSEMPALQKLRSAYGRNHSAQTAVTKVYNDLIFNISRAEDTIIVLLVWLLTLLIKIHFLMTYSLWEMMT